LAQAIVSAPLPQPTSSPMPPFGSFTYSAIPSTICFDICRFPLQSNARYSRIIQPVTQSAMTVSTRNTMNSTVFAVPETNPLSPNTIHRIRNSTVAPHPVRIMPFGIQFL
jgi:hypothetical protein